MRLLEAGHMYDPGYSSLTRLENMGKRIDITCPVTGDRSLTPPSCKWDSQSTGHVSKRFTPRHILLTSASVRIRAGWPLSPLSLLLMLTMLEFTLAK